MLSAWLWFHRKLCFRSNSLGMPVLPVVKVTRATLRLLTRLAGRVGTVSVLDLSLRAAFRLRLVT